MFVYNKLCLKQVYGDFPGFYEISIFNINDEGKGMEAWKGRKL